MKYTNEELRKRVVEHERNAENKISLMTWNKSESTIEQNQLLYKTTQMKLANAFAELLKYRTADPNYKEE